MYESGVNWSTWVRRLRPPLPFLSIARRVLLVLFARMLRRLVDDARTDSPSSFPRSHAGKTLAYTRVELESAKTGKLLAYGPVSSSPPSLPTFTRTYTDDKNVRGVQGRTASTLPTR